MTDRPFLPTMSIPLNCTGWLQPDHEHAVQAMTALKQQRYSDALNHIREIPETPIFQRAWKMFLLGRVHLAQSQLGDAESSLLQAAAMAFIDGMGTNQMSQSMELRLCACALHHAGKVLRRRDRPDDAWQTHQSAYQLREQHGSPDELWETAIELGLDADLARRYEDAHTWFRKAIEFADHADQDSQQKRAIAWTHLSNSFTQCDKFDEAVNAARTARECWMDYDASNVSVAQADLTLGSALLKFAAYLYEQSDPRVESVLDEALTHLNVARESLLAFGPDHAADVHWCEEQQQFAEQLQSALVT